ncbi:MAG TPA: hypothetical protein V6D29_06055 [Leptolyngbyaceae cyanobacterium]
MAKLPLVPILASDREIQPFALERNQQKASVMFFENRLYQLQYTDRSCTIWDIYALAMNYRQRGYSTVITTDINTYKVWTEMVQDTSERFLAMNRQAA